jgi:hypothetical protein
MRHLFGGGITDLILTEVDSVDIVGDDDNADDMAQLTQNATVTFFNAQTGGSQYTDLRMPGAPDTVVDHVMTADGTGTLPLGAIPQVFGPEGVWLLWASADGGNRSLMVTSDVAALGPVVETLVLDLLTHIQTSNPHQTAVADLANVDTALTEAAVEGQLLVFDETLGDEGLWRPANVPGLAGTVQTTGVQNITGEKRFSPTTVDDHAGMVTALAGQIADIWGFQTATGQRTGYANEKGELRALPAAPNSVAFRVKGLPGQTANLQEWTDNGLAILALCDALGRLRAPNINSGPTLWVQGTLAVGVGGTRWYNDTGQALTLRSIRASVVTAPGGASIVIDVNLNGVTACPVTKPTIISGAVTSGKVTPGVTTWPDGAYLSVDVDAVGSAPAGAGLTVQILAY